MRNWACWRSTCPEWSGDFVDHVELSQSRHVVIVGDVAGHGDLAGDAAHALRAFATRRILEGLTLRNTVRSASAYFAEALLTDPTPFASLFIAVADLNDGTLRYASAGHEPALLFSGNGTHEHLGPTGPVLGVAADLAFRERVLHLPDDATLVVVTDGITEARHKGADPLTFFGSRGVVAAIRRAAREGGDPADAVFASALEHAGGALADDATVFVSSLTAEPACCLRLALRDSASG